MLLLRFCEWLVRPRLILLIGFLLLWYCVFKPWLLQFYWWMRP
jgi:hypothetical protein